MNGPALRAGSSVPRDTSPVLLDGSPVLLDQVVRVADGAPVVVHDSVVKMLRVRRQLVERILASDQPVYGINTGFGKLSEVTIPHDRLLDLQINLVRSHAVGVGALLPEREVRAMMFLRANVLTLGYSGARPELPLMLVAMLNAGICPAVPEQGSVGASGDLAPLAHLALSMIGEGELCENEDGHSSGVQRGNSREKLRAAGIEPLTLQAKEGIALINGTQAHTAIAALAIHEAQLLWRTAHFAGAASLEALLGTPDAFDERIQRVRGQVGQEKSGRLLRELLGNSTIRESHRLNDPRVQDAYSLRCMPQVHGAVYDGLAFAAGIIARELNAATDNPLVFPDGAILSGGNFHGQPVAMALDLMCIALTNLATMSERRIDRLVHPDLNQGLPPFLSTEPGINSGYMMVQVTAAALASECKLLSHPASVDTIPTDGSKEDVVPMAMAAALKTRRIVRNVRTVLAIELLCSAQAIDFRRPLRASDGVEELLARVRALVPHMTDDRPPAPDIAAVAEALSRGVFAPSFS